MKAIDLAYRMNLSESKNKLVQLRYVALVANANQMCYLGAQHNDQLNKARKFIYNIAMKLKGSTKIGLTNFQSQKVIDLTLR